MHPNHGVVLAVLAAALGCAGGIEGAGMQPPPGAPDRAPVPPGPGGVEEPPAPPPGMGGTAGALRLTTAEYLGSLRALFPGVKLPALALDASGSGFSAIAASVEAIGPAEVNEYFDAAVAISKQVVADARMRQAVVGCQPSGPADAACAERFVTGFGRLVWRRPLTAAEVQRLSGLLLGAARELDSFWDGVELTLRAFLQSPHFLYRFEIGRPDGLLTGYELATRLSYMLSGTTPAPALLDAAGRGELEPDAPGLRARIGALLADPKVRDGFGRFFREWLHLDELPLVNRDAKAPAPTATDPNATTNLFTASLVADMQSETLRVLTAAAFEDGRDFTEVLTTRETFLNQRLAALYGVPSPAPDARTFARTTLPEDQPRAGLLGHASFLALHATPKASSPIHRGVAIMGSFLCREIPPPPPEVSAPPASSQPMTARQQLERHRTDPGCAACHSLIDPLGLALEHFDHVGRFRANDRGLPIDASGTLDDRRFAGAPGLGTALRGHPDVHACVIRQLLQYARGQVDPAIAEPRVAALAGRFRDGGFRFPSLLVDLVTDPVFLKVGGPR